MAKPDGLMTHVLVKSAPAFDVGTAVFTVTITASLAVHPLAGFVPVKVYVVVAVGSAVGLEMVALLNPAVGVHEYVVAPEATIPIAAPAGFVTHVTVASAPALMVGAVVFTVTKT